jgi:hypothetical protein
MSRLAEKAKQVADNAHALAAETEADLDASLAKQQDVKTRKDAAVQKLSAVIADVDAGTASIEEVVKNLTNSPPA